jgi:hypothetical protein
MQGSDAEAAVLLEWTHWVPKNLPGVTRPTTADARMFFVHLQTERPDLLLFDAAGDKWLVVHGWLQSRSLVAD